MQPNDRKFTPQQAIDAWPADRPLAALVTASPDERWGRWSLLAAPARVVTAHAHDEAVRAIEEASSDGGTWLVALAYELGAAFEPTALPRRRAPDDGWPLAILARCDSRIVHDDATGLWRAEGDAASEGLLAEVSARAERGERGGEAASVTGLEQDIARAEYERMVAEAVELVRAGDIFQANVAQRFSARWAGSPRAVLRAALRAARADRLQTSLNLAIGSAMASIGLTVPVVAAASVWLGLPLTLGIENKDIALLTLTFVVGSITLATGRTNMLQGAIHLVIFAAFLFLTLVP